VGAARAEYGGGYTMYCGTGVHLPLPSARQSLAYQTDSSACLTSTQALCQQM